MRVRVLLGLASSILALASVPCFAQSTTASTEAVIVTGTRGQPRTQLDSPVPVDVISEDAIKSTPFADIDNVLNVQIPSFQVNRNANSTSGTFIRPVSIRGLPEDEVLLLMNGKRRHLSASAAVSGTGAEGPDAAVIPTFALKSIQVLRDGAAAQYGSDAIAGVVNFILKDDDHGFELNAQAGTTSHNDGDNAIVAANLGLPIPFLNKGFINLTAEYDRQGNTVRGGLYVNPGNFNCVTYAAANPEYNFLINGNCNRAQTGQPSLEAFKSVINMGLPITDTSSLYAFGNFSISEGWAIGSYRFPGGNQQVNGPRVRLPDGSTFSFTDMFPAGWNPYFGAQVKDWSATGGYKGTIPVLGNNLSYDFSYRYGWDEIAYNVKNTVNPSLGPNTPHSFHPYADIAGEQSLNADFTYPVSVAFFATPLILSAGAEYRHQTYRIEGGLDRGDPASIAVGPYAAKDPYGFCNGNVPTAKGAGLPASAGLNCANASDPVYQTLPAGSNSITGLPPVSTGHWTDSNTSFYVEGDTSITDNWEVDVAARFENYASFGTNTTEKIASRVQLTDWLALRGSAGTGFHAPPPGMLHQTNIQLLTTNGISVQTGLFPADNPVSQFLGAKPLQPEKSVNFSAGLTANPIENLTLTLDAYYIRMFGQIYSVNPIAVTPAIAAQIAAAGINGSGIQSVYFEQNAFDSNTQGIDLVATYLHPWEDQLLGYDQSSNATLSFNMNRYYISRVKIPNLFTVAQVYNFEHNTPKWRSVLTLVHDAGPFEALVRANLFGTYAYTTTTYSAFQQYPDLTAQFDLEGSYRLNDQWKFSAGILNIFNKYPDPNRINYAGAALYVDNGIPWSTGSYYFVRAQFDL
jgi:iron complex outermembrane receptor protein